MMKISISEAPFEPLLSKQEVVEGLSAENCRERDVGRRVMAMVCTKTADDLRRVEESALIEMKQIVETLLSSGEAELEVARAAAARLQWAIEVQGLRELDDR